jgi:hypothetical protein
MSNLVRLRGSVVVDARRSGERLADPMGEGAREEVLQVPDRSI